MNPGSLRLKALNELTDLINNKDDCWTRKNINPTTYKDLFEFWANQGQSGQKLNNIQLVDLKCSKSPTIFSPNVFGTLAGDVVRKIIEDYKDILLPSIGQEEAQRLSL